MTERTPPAWLQSGAYPAEDDRRLIATIFSDSEGIILPTDLAVSQRGAGANMSVDVAGGRAVVKGDQATYEGSYFMENRGVTNLTIAAADPTNPRVDRVIAEVLNQEYSGVSNLWRLRVMTGTPAGSPVAPTLPVNAISLATVAVAALAGSIVNANITNLRTAAWIGNGTIICTSTSRPASPFEGMEIYETDTDKTYIYGGAAWFQSGGIGAADTFTPALTQSVTVTKTVNQATYHKIGRRCIGETHMTITGAGTATQAIVVGLPLTGAAIGGTPIIGTFWVYDNSAGLAYHGALVQTSTTQAVGWVTGNTGNVGVTPNFGLASPDQVGYSFSYPTAA